MKALLLVLFLSGCALDDLWRDSAQSECDKNTVGSARMDCYDRVDRQAREIERQ